MTVILGAKHSGKTAAGKMLAEKIGAPFYDLDEIIAAGGKTPRELWREGAEVFRRAELAALENLKIENDAVLAAGGGIIDNAAALSLLASRTGIVFVCLEIEAETAWKRIKDASALSGLPPFLDKPGENPEALHRELHTRRQAAYRAFADEVKGRGGVACIVAAGGKSAEEIAVEIMRTANA